MRPFFVAGIRRIALSVLVVYRIRVKFRHLLAGRTLNAWFKKY